MIKGFLTIVKPTIKMFSKFHMDKKEINPRLPQVPVTYVLFRVCALDHTPPMVYLSSDEEGVIRSPVVYPSSYGKGSHSMVRSNDAASADKPYVRT